MKTISLLTTMMMQKDNFGALYCNRADGALYYKTDDTSNPDFVAITDTHGAHLGLDSYDADAFGTIVIPS